MPWAGRPCTRDEPFRRCYSVRMKLAKYIAIATDSSDIPGVGIVDDTHLIPIDLVGSGYKTLSDILAAPSPAQAAESLSKGEPIPLDEVRWLPPIDSQEVWAAGVTYKRSQTARMEESEAAASCYDRVYTADRPELFFKATPSRVRGHGGALRIRYDATWNVPEPEITLVINPKMKIIGLTIGNDMSSRDIEGDNPLYLPQAKCYDACAGLGPWISLLDPLPPVGEIGVELNIVRRWLGRDNIFPNGAFLMTGTGIVPTSDFTLHPGDVVHITIDHVGTLTNTIIQSSPPRG